MSSPGNFFMAIVKTHIVLLGLGLNYTIMSVDGKGEKCWFLSLKPVESPLNRSWIQLFAG
jgi:hypothetical protein